jgi:hypothetical protein
MTSPNDNKLIGLRDSQKSFQEVFHAAEYNKGGRNTRNTISGSRLIKGMPGMKLISKPMITRNMG